MSIAMDRSLWKILNNWPFNTSLALACSLPIPLTATIRVKNWRFLGLDPPSPRHWTQITIPFLQSWNQSTTKTKSQTLNFPRTSPKNSITNKLCPILLPVNKFLRHTLTVISQLLFLQSLSFSHRLMKSLEERDTDRVRRMFEFGCVYAMEMATGMFNTRNTSISWLVPCKDRG